MNIRGRVTSFYRNTFSFDAGPTTILTILIYVAIFASSIILYELPPRVPPLSEQHGLDAGQAFRDLQSIATYPHPYNSHANNNVRAYILSRVTDVAKLYNNVHVVDDIVSNATWAVGDVAGVYFEGENILVKVDGRHPELKAVLLSAHFDSVSTAPGATDDGMGVSTLLQLVEYFAAHTPRRTVIFNINNGEEDGLHGAHVFLEHEWSALPGSFLNLEGAGSGGRPLLFRTSSAAVTRAFSNVPHPHGSVLTSDAFSLGLVRSGTDFSVYATRGFKGLDLAFYRRRSLYHTRDDSVPSLGGAEPLWNMMEASLASAIALTEATDENVTDEQAVYFDVYGEAFMVYTLKTVFIVNLVLLIVGPLLIVAGVSLLSAKRKGQWPASGWIRLPIALIFSLGLTIGLSFLIISLNPYIVYSAGYSVVASQISLALLGLQLPLMLFSQWKPISQQKTMVLVETYVLWWILLVFDTAMLNEKKIGGFYFITFFHAAAFLALAVALLGHLRLPSRPRHQPQHNVDRAEVEAEETHPEEVATETTPLIQRQVQESVDDMGDASRYGIWILEYLLLVPFPAILVSQVCLLLLGGLSQTLVDGSSPGTVYMGLAATCFLLMLPLAPFAHNLHRLFPTALLVILIVTGLYNLVSFPFSTASPMKVFFIQTLDLDTGINTVNLTGLGGFVDKYVIPDLPSTWNQTVECGDSQHKGGLWTCRWSGLPPAAVSSGKTAWLEYSATRSGPGAAVISLRGANTRSCRIYFDRRVTSVRVENAAGDVQSDYPMPADGITQLRLWSRTWDRAFVVSVGWQAEGDAGDDAAGGEDEKLTGRVACGWAESQRVPAFGEVAGFIPSWAEVTKMDDALLEASRKFSV